jgi:hypothetical protein
MSYPAGCTEDHIDRSAGCGEMDRPRPANVSAMEAAWAKRMLDRYRAPVDPDADDEAERAENARDAEGDAKYHQMAEEW